MTLTQILAYANILTENAFVALANIIDYLNEAQDLIARWDPIPATPVTYTLTTNEITLPVDFMQFDHATLDDIPYAPPAKRWGSTLTLHYGLTSGTFKLWYFRFPVILLSSTPTQVPDVGVQYHRAMAAYAAKMFNLVDDDPALREAFKSEFVSSLASMKMSDGLAIQYNNF